MNMDDAMSTRLEKLKKMSGASVDIEVFRKALGLLEVHLDAKLEGRYLQEVDPNDPNFIPIRIVIL